MPTKIIPPTDTSHYTNNFDFIRLTAAVFVLITHSFQLSTYFHTDSEWMEQLSRYHYPLSYFGVGIFFIISGYLISQSLYRSSSAFNYLKKRVIRIFPGLLVALFLTIMLLGPWMTSLSWADYFTRHSTYTYLKNGLLFQAQAGLPGVFLKNPIGTLINGSLWTLVYEFSFYLILLGGYWIGFWRLRFMNAVLFVGCISLVTMLKHSPIYYHYYPSINMSPGDFIRFWLFFWSGVMAFLYKDQIRYTSLGALICATVLVGLIVSQQFLLFDSLVYLILTYLIFYLAFLPGLLNRFGRYGDFSYGLYIYSFPVQQIIIALAPKITGPQVMILTSLAVVPLAWMSWNWIESPAIQWGKQKSQVPQENPHSTIIER